jgi:hypothetical protein
MSLVFFVENYLNNLSEEDLNKMRQKELTKYKAICKEIMKFEEFKNIEIVIKFFFFFF